MAELVFAVLERQSNASTDEVAVWQAPHNAAGATITWRFTTPAARTRLARHYPAQTA